MSMTGKTWSDCLIYFAPVRNKIRKPVVQSAQGAKKPRHRRLAQRLHFLLPKEVVEATRAKKTTKKIRLCASRLDYLSRDSSS